MKRGFWYWFYRIRATWAPRMLWLDLKWRWKTKPWRPEYWRARKLFRERLIEFRRTHPKK